MPSSAELLLESFNARSTMEAGQCAVAGGLGEREHLHISPFVLTGKQTLFALRANVHNVAHFTTLEHGEISLQAQRNSDVIMTSSLWGSLQK